MYNLGLKKLKTIKCLSIYLYNHILCKWTMICNGCIRGDTPPSPLQVKINNF